MSKISTCELFFIFAIVCILCLMGFMYIKQKNDIELDIDCDCHKKSN